MLHHHQSPPTKLVAGVTISGCPWPRLVTGALCHLVPNGANIWRQVVSMCHQLLELIHLLAGYTRTTRLSWRDWSERHDWPSRGSRRTWEARRIGKTGMLKHIWSKFLHWGIIFGTVKFEWANLATSKLKWAKFVSLKLSWLSKFGTFGKVNSIAWLYRDGLAIR